MGDHSSQPPSFFHWLNERNFLLRSLIVCFSFILFSHKTHSQPVNQQHDGSPLIQVNVTTPVFNSSYVSDSSMMKKRRAILHIFQPLYPLIDSAKYFIRLCADIPDNKNPRRIHIGDETGHVFIILTKTVDTVGHSVSFGFYPRKPIQSIFFKRVKSKILKNYSREYDVSITRNITPYQLSTVLQYAMELAVKKYDMRRFNCYDYALAIFNSIAGTEKIPVTRMRFPLFLGKGGSPCCLYNDLKNMKDRGCFINQIIEFGNFQSPPAKN